MEELFPFLTPENLSGTIKKMFTIRIPYGLFYLCTLLSVLLGWNSAFAFFHRYTSAPLKEEKANFWTEMSKDFAIECDTKNPYIQQQIQWYQQHPQQLWHLLVKAEPLIHHVHEQTHQRSLPGELALIPLLESQYNPTLGAKSGAAGLWQIMPGTARKFGLKITPSYDGRRDVTASTQAALSYLSYLHRYFNKNWLLAVAAYEVGEGKMQAITRHEHNFWHLPLPRETKEYVPRLLAIAHLIKQQHPGCHPLPEMPPLSSPQAVPSNTTKSISYQVRAGDNLYSIARTFHVPLRRLISTNPQLRPKPLKIGRTLIIPLTRTNR